MFEVGAFRFTAPSGWQQIAPRSRMRKAEFEVPDPAGGGAGHCTFYHFGPGRGGSVDANMTRWREQFQEPAQQIKAEVERKSFGRNVLHYFQASGTFLAGRPGGPKRAVPDHTLMAAIIESAEGHVFIRFVASDALAGRARRDFRRMVESPFMP